MTRDQIIDALRALGVRRIPADFPPFRTRCACRAHHGTRDELPRGHDWHQAHGGRGCTDAPPVADVVGLELRCDCGKGFGMNAAGLMKHCKDDHGRKATEHERTPR